MLAIVIPYYKLSFFNETLLSLANQTDKRFKVYIGDDASPENCSSLLEENKDKFDFKYKKFKDNLGRISLVKHWERCIAMTGDEDWLMILGDDDVLGNNVVRSFYKRIIQINISNLKVIRFSTIKIDKDSNPISKVFTHPEIEKSTDFYMRLLEGKTRSSLSEYIFSKPTLQIKKFKNFPLAWYSDILAVLEFSNFENVFSINLDKVYVRISDKSISGSPYFVKEKYKASALFYGHIIKNINKFNSSNRDFILKIIEKNYLNNKKNFQLYFKIIKYYIFHFQIKKIIKLNFKMI